LRDIASAFQYRCSLQINVVQWQVMMFVKYSLIGLVFLCTAGSALAEPKGAVSAYHAGTICFTFQTRETGATWFGVNLNVSTLQGNYMEAMRQIAARGAQVSALQLSQHFNQVVGFSPTGKVLSECRSDLQPVYEIGNVNSPPEEGQ
jgi:hypothetical protein